MTRTQAEIKKLVIGGRKVNKYDQVKLFLSEHDGELYATNSYWMVKASMVRVLLEHFNLPIDQAGSFTVNGKISPLDIEPPRVGSLIPRVKDCQVLERTKVSNRDAYAKRYGGFLALLEQPGEAPQGFNDDFLSWITFDGDLCNAPMGYGSRLVGEPIYRQEKTGRPLLIHAKREKSTGGHNGPDGKYVPQAWVADGEEFLGLLMPVKLG